jgi:Flp pilus assembly protein TadG
MKKKTLQSARDERGSILILTALIMAVLLGFLALTVDASFMYDTRNRLHAVADAAAKSAAFEIQRGNSGAIDTFALHVINDQISAGNIPSNVATSRVVRLCSAAGATCGASHASSGFVEVILQSETNTFFAKVLGITSMTPAARAVAGFSSSANCLVTGPFDGTTGGSSITMSGSLNASGCNIAANGNIVASGHISAASVATTDDCIGSGCPSPPILQEDAPVTADPLASLPAPANPGGCAPFTASGAVTLGHTDGTPVCYSSVSVSGSVTLRPGVYYMNGNLTVSGSLTGTGVMLYFQSGSLSVSGSVTISAPTSGTYRGIAIYQRSGNNSNPTVSGSVTVNGALYFPTASLVFSGGVHSSSDCALVVAKGMTFSGSLANTCSSFGGSPFSSVAMAE